MPTPSQAVRPPCSFVLLLGGLFLAYHMGVFILAGVRLPIMLVGFTVPLDGLLVGYGLATCLKLPVAQRRTVSIEVGANESSIVLETGYISSIWALKDQ